MKFNSREIKDLWIAGLMISLAFAILLSGGLTGVLSFSSGFFVVFLISFFTAGVGFLLHEMMHKYVAQSYGLKAEFRASYGMLWLAIFFSFLGFIIAAPGAVMIRGFMNREKNGKISLAGPMTNIVLAGIFLGLILFVGGQGIVGVFFRFGLTINALLGAFNLIPVRPFDGGKVLVWNKGAYFVSLIIAVLLLVAGFSI